MADGLPGSRGSRRHPRRRRRLLLPAIAAVVALIVPGCRGSEDGEPPDGAMSGASSISYAGAASWLAELPTDERDDQLRDLAQLGVASMLGLSAEAFGAAFYDKPVLRDELFDDIGTRPAPGRSIPDGKGTVHLLVPADDRSPNRTIGTLLDQHRLDAGEDTERAQVHRYTIDTGAEQVALESGPVRATADIRAEAGYQEAPIRTVDELGSFLSRNEHLSRVEVRAGEVWAAGWDWPDVPSAAVTAADLTVIQDGTGPLGAPGFSLDPAPLDPLALLDNDSEVPLSSPAWERLTDPAEALLAIIGPGAADHLATMDQGMVVALAELAHFGEDAATRQEAISALGLRDETAAAVLYKALRGLPLFSVARYEGGTKGTEVGMTLFYTDHIAKEWTSSIGSGVPSDHGIDRFVTELNQGTNWAHCPTEEESGRLWFGLDTTSVAASDGAIGFGGVATRLFTRSDAVTGVSGGQEVEPSYHFGRALRWWDRHYRDVADYEPQYQRLDQIMRWSAAIAWLDDQGERLPAVPAGEVDRTLRFEDWFASRDDLKERQAPVPVEVGDGIEAIASRYSPPHERCGQLSISGGVTLAGPDVVNRLRSTRPDVAPALGRTGIVEGTATGAGPGRIVTGALDDTAAVIDDVAREITTTPDGMRVKVEAYGREVNTTGGVRLVGVEQSRRGYDFDLTARPGELSVRASAHGLGVGELIARARSDGAVIEWRPSVGARLRRFATRIQRQLTQRSRDRAVTLDEVVGDIEGIVSVHDGRGTVVGIADGARGEFFAVAPGGTDGPGSSQARARVVTPGDDPVNGASTLSPAPRPPDLDGPAVTRALDDIAGDDGRARVNLGVIREVRRSEATAAEVDAGIAEGIATFTIVLDDGQPALGAIRRQTRLEIIDVEIAGAVLPDLQLFEGRAYRRAEATGAAPGSRATQIRLVRCADPREHAGEADEEEPCAA